MGNYRYLRFFDGRGDDMNLEYDQATDAWSGRVYMPRVATDLHENEHVFVLERVLTGSPADQVDCYPLVADPLSSTPNFYTEWQDNRDRSIFTYEIEESDNRPYIVVYERIDHPAGPVPFASGPGGQKVALGTLTSGAMQVNVAFASPDEGIYERTLLIKDASVDGRLVASIIFYAESVGEDERFRLMLENFGRRLDQRDAVALREYDIREDLPDWQQINRKRKELLVAGEEIFPYIGTYRGLINIIKFFGYQDMRVKEYWLNVDQTSENYGKRRQVQVNGLLTDENSPMLRHPLIPTTTYKKTGDFGLFYDITRQTDRFDEYGVPITENASQFTPEEVLIKLFSLKEKLMKDYMPVSARIVDIVGEGVYFEQYRVRSWTDPLTVFPVEVSTRVGFEAEPREGYVRDLRRFRPRRFEQGLDLPVGQLGTQVGPYEVDQQYPASAVPGLLAAIELYYAQQPVVDSEELRENFDGDEPQLDFPYTYYQLNSTPMPQLTLVPAGCPVVLTARIGQFSWDDLTTTGWMLDVTDRLPYALLANDSGLVSVAVANDLVPGDRVVFDQADGGSANPMLQGEQLVVGSTATSVTIDLPWSDITDPSVSGEMGLLGMQYTWDDIDFANFYEIEWEISKAEGQPYFFTLRGPVRQYYRLPHFLPFAGEYEVRMTLFDLQNNPSTDIQRSCVRVLSHELELCAFTKWRGHETYTWENSNTWDDFGVSSWHMPSEGVGRADSPLTDGDLNFARYENQEQAQVLNPTTGQYEYYMQSTSPHADRFGTMRLNWDATDASWDDMFHQTWSMYEFHSEFLGGFRIYDPQIGDGFRIDDYPIFYFYDLSPSISPMSLQDAVDQLMASDNPGVRLFGYRVYQGPGTPHIVASGKTPGPASWHFVEQFPLPTSPSLLQIDPYTFTYPTWVEYQGVLQDFLLDNPGADPNLLFLDAPIADIADGSAGTVQYWQQAGYLKTEPPSQTFPLGERRGALPSIVGQGAFNAADLRVFREDFQAPVGAVLFVTHNFSQIPGKRKARWRVTNTVSGDVFLDVISHCLIVNFALPGKYDLELWLEDSNGNESYTRRNGFITAVERKIAEKLNK